MDEHSECVFLQFPGWEGKFAHWQNTKWNLLIAEPSKRMSRRVCVATCCVLLKPVEFVRELFPAYSPDVVVKVPPWRKKIFSVMYTTDDKSLNLYYCKYGDGKKWHIVERKILSFSEKKKKKLFVVVNRGGPEGMLPRVALSFSSSSLITDWIRSDEWWRGVRGGWGVDRTCSQSCPSRM